MGAFKELIKGEKSLHGDASLEDAVLDPPGDSIDWAQSPVGIIKDNPVAEEDLTIEDLDLLEDVDPLS
jgi:hypothetical protein